MSAFLESLLRDLDAARHRVLLDTPVFASDRIARMIGARLYEAAARGADVRLLYDVACSRAFDPGHRRALGRWGIKARASRPRGGTHAMRPLSRDKASLCVVDGVAYTGGFGIADAWLPRARGGDGHHGLTVRVSGPLAADATISFESRWREALGASPDPLDTGGRHQDVRLCFEPAGSSEALVALPLEAFRRARRRLWLETSLFAPSEPLERALVAAARRRVDVRLILPERGHSPLLARTARAHFGPWLRAGVRIFEYLPAHLEGHTLLVDEGLVLVGAPSGRPAFSLALQCRDPSLAAQLEAQLEHDLTACRPVSLEDLETLGRVERALDRLAAGLMRVTETTGA